MVGRVKEGEMFTSWEAMMTGLVLEKLAKAGGGMAMTGERDAWAPSAPKWADVSNLTHRCRELVTYYERERDLGRGFNLPGPRTLGEFVAATERMEAILRGEA